MNVVLKATAALDFAQANSKRLTTYLWRITHRNDIARELLQDLYVALLSRPPVIADSVSSYVFSIAHNLAIDHVRCCDTQRMQYVPDIDESNEPITHSCEDLAETDADLAQMIAAVQRLSPVKRQVFVLKKVYGYSQAEIATRLGISENTVEQHITKAIRDLARILGEPVFLRKNGRIITRLKK